MRAHAQPGNGAGSSRRAGLGSRDCAVPLHPALRCGDVFDGSRPLRYNTIGTRVIDHGHEVAVGEGVGVRDSD